MSSESPMDWKSACGFPFFYLLPPSTIQNFATFACKSRYSVREAEIKLSHSTHAHTGVQNLRWSELIALTTDLHYK